MAIGLTPAQLMPVHCTPQVNLGFQMEDWDEDLGAELAEDPELEEKGHKDEDKNDLDAMLGEVVIFQRKFTGVSCSGMESRKVAGLLKKHDNLYEIPLGIRGAVYRYWEKKLDQRMGNDMRRLLQEYAKCVRDTKITKVSIQQAVRRCLKLTFPVYVQHPTHQPPWHQGNWMHHDRSVEISCFAFSSLPSYFVN